MAAQVTKDDAMVVSLIKPQFEAGREQVGKNGIVRDAKVHLEVIEKVLGFAEENGFVPVGLTYSPIKGAKGNIEYLVLLKKGAADEERLREGVPAAVVEQAHSDLKNKAD